MDQETSTAKEKQRGARVASVRAFLVEASGTLLPAVVIAVLLHLFLAQSTVVYGQSMEPNYATDQRLIIEKLSYHFRTPRRGDVVILADPNGGPIPLIKRVVGLPGERVTIGQGQVYIDGARLDEPYVTQHTTGLAQSWVVPPLEVFVMGDNRSNSRDSRYFGAVPLDSILGHAVFRYWPLGELGLSP
jgi:signal peptidase I